MKLSNNANAEDSKALIVLEKLRNISCTEQLGGNCKAPEKPPSPETNTNNNINNNNNNDNNNKNDNNNNNNNNNKGLLQCIPQREALHLQ